MTAPANIAELKRLAEAFKTSREAFMALPEADRQAPGVPEFWGHYRAFADAFGYDTALSLISTIERQAEEIAGLREGLRPFADHYVGYLADTPPFTVLPITVEYRAIRTAFNLSHSKTKEGT